MAISRTTINVIAMQPPRHYILRQLRIAFKHFFLQAEIGNQMLQPSVLVFQALQSLCLAHFETAVFTLSGVNLNSEIN